MIFSFFFQIENGKGFVPITIGYGCETVIEYLLPSKFHNFEVLTHTVMIFGHRACRKEYISWIYSMNKILEFICFQVFNVTLILKISSQCLQLTLNTLHAYQLQSCFLYSTLKWKRAKTIIYHRKQHFSSERPLKVIIFTYFPQVITIKSVFAHKLYKTLSLLWENSIWIHLFPTQSRDSWIPSNCFLV